MKRIYIIVIIAVALCILGCQRNSYRIEGQAQGFNKGDKLLLVTDLSTMTSADTLVIDEEGRFQKKGLLDSTQIALIYDAADPTLCVTFIMEPGIIEVNLSQDGHSHVGGTTRNDKWQMLTDQLINYEQRIEELTQHFYDEQMSEEELRATTEEIRRLYSILENQQLEE